MDLDFGGFLQIQYYQGNDWIIWPKQRAQFIRYCYLQLNYTWCVQDMTVYATVEPRIQRYLVEPIRKAC